MIHFNPSRSCQAWRKKLPFFFGTAILFFSCFSFSSEALGADEAAQSRPRFEAYDCDLDCGIGGSCVPDLAPSFSTLLAHHDTGTVPFRCYDQKEEAASATLGSDDDDDGVFSDDFFLPPDGCPNECQNGGKCISIFGGLSFACLCVEPFWGSACELNGTEDSCQLDCNSIGRSDDVLGNNVSQSREGAFCVESPENSGDQTCVHCEEIYQEDEPNCNDLIDCKNGGDCKVEYQFVIASDVNTTGDNEANSVGPFKCSSTTSMAITSPDGSTSMQTVWMSLPPYTISCECQPGFQGETCEEIDVCDTGCQNNGYCISKDTPGNELGSDDFFNFNTDDSNNNDDFFYIDFDDDDDSFDDDIIMLDDVFWEYDDDNFVVPPDFGIAGCTCYEGHCDQTSCGAGATCAGGMCIQDRLVSPMCSGGKCSQRHAHNPSCTGGDCDQTAAVDGTCGGTDCFSDEFEAQTIVPDTVTMPPEFQPFCSCEYGFFGDLCQHEITTICLLDDSGYNHLLHEVCLRLGGLCPLDVGNRFCTNGGSCGNITNFILSNSLGANDFFTCDCPTGFEGVHCEIPITELPSAQPTRREPITGHRVSSSPLPFLWRWLALVSIVPCVTILL